MSGWNLLQGYDVQSSVPERGSVIKPTKPSNQSPENLIEILNETFKNVSQKYNKHISLTNAIK